MYVLGLKRGADTVHVSVCYMTGSLCGSPSATLTPLVLDSCDRGVLPCTWLVAVCFLHVGLTGQLV